MNILVASTLALLSATETAQSVPAFSFDPSEVAWAARPGNSVVEGRPIMALDGEQNACTEAILVPFSTYDEIVLKFWYSDDLSQVLRFGPGIKEKYYAPEYPMIKDKVNRKLWINQIHFRKNCDDSGYVRFDNIPAGRYFLTLRYVRGFTTVSHGSYVKDRIPSGFSIVRRVEVISNSIVDFDASGQMKR